MKKYKRTINGCVLKQIWLDAQKITLKMQKQLGLRTLVHQAAFTFVSVSAINGTLRSTQSVWVGRFETERLEADREQDEAPKDDPWGLRNDLLR